MKTLDDERNQKIFDLQDEIGRKDEETNELRKDLERAKKKNDEL